MKNFLVKLFLLLLISENVFALSPEDHLAEPLEERARNIFLQVKCPVCEGQVIESSDTEAALGLRNLIREKITDGKSDEEIKFYLISKYGADIINAPSFNYSTYFLWLMPVIFFVFGGVLIAIYFHQRFRVAKKEII